MTPRSFAFTQTGRCHLDPYRPELGPREQASSNQDGFLALDHRKFWAIFDFWGGFLGTSGWASDGISAALQALERFSSSPAILHPTSGGLTALLQSVHDGIQSIQIESAHSGYYPTCSILAAYLTGTSLHLAHVGDCRAYLLRGSTFRQLTDDHTWVAEQLRAGELTPEQARSHPLKDVSTRAVGGFRPSYGAPDLINVAVAEFDRLLLLSDGVWKVLTDAELHATAADEQPQFIPTTLVARAVSEGSVDDLTALCVTFGTPPEA